MEDVMATKQQIFNACDEAMKGKIACLLARLWASIGSSENKNFQKRFDDSIEEYTEIFFKLINMDKKHCSL